MKDPGFTYHRGIHKALKNNMPQYEGRDLCCLGEEGGLAYRSQRHMAEGVKAYRKLMETPPATTTQEPKMTLPPTPSTTVPPTVQPQPAVVIVKQPTTAAPALVVQAAAAPAVVVQATAAPAVA